MKQVDQILHKVKSRWLIQIWIQILLNSLLLSITISLPLFLIVDSYFVVFCIIPITVSILLFYRKKFPNNLSVYQLINKQLEEVEFSTALLVRSDLTGIGELQKLKILKKLQGQFPRLKYPVSWLSTILITILGISMVIVFSQTQFKKESNNIVPSLITKNNASAIVTKADSVFLSGLEIQTIPPKYTAMMPREAADPNLDVIEGSIVNWKASFIGTPTNVWVEFSNGDSLCFLRKDENWILTEKRIEQGYYTFNFQDSSGSFITSPFYQFRIIPDKSPAAKIEGIPQFQRLKFEKDIAIKFDVLISDDFGLSDAFVVATITKGAGESVMFREQKFNFSNPISGKAQKLKMQFNTSDFEMEPGNELYFYVSVSDNKEPAKQTSKTETYFIVLEDTSKLEFTLEGNLGVDIMPAFFKSQLQLILDTEKLISEKENLSRHDFNFTSNELGFDQKQLRLKYGQFIGEEEDSGLDIEQEGREPVVINAEDENADQNLLDEFGHNTDRENEKGQLLDKGTWQHNEHDENIKLSGKEEKENPLSAYIHEHGEEETATFLGQSIKTKLKAALAQMWDSELYLRLYQPEVSLPFQYESLKLLNEIKNHARIYVQRIGFDPPPINEDENRLSKEAKDAFKDSFYSTIHVVPEYPEIRKAVSSISTILYSENNENTLPKTLQNAGNEMAQIAIRTPGLYLDELNAIQILKKLNTFSNEDKAILKHLLNTFIALLPDENMTNLQFVEPQHLNTAFIDELSKVKIE